MVVNPKLINSYFIKIIRGIVLFITLSPPFCVDLMIWLFPVLRQQEGRTIYCAINLSLTYFKKKKSLKNM